MTYLAESGVGEDGVALAPLGSEGAEGHVRDTVLGRQPPHLPVLVERVHPTGGQL